MAELDGNNRLGAPADPAPRARGATAHGRACRTRAPLPASARCCSAATASCCGWRPASPERSTRCRPDASTRMARSWSAPRNASSPTAAVSVFPGLFRSRSPSATRGELVADPDVTLTGIPAADRQGRLIEDIAYDAALEAFESMPRARRRDPEAVAEAVRRAIRAAVGSALEQEAQVSRARAGGVIAIVRRRGIGDQDALHAHLRFADVPGWGAPRAVQFAVQKLGENHDRTAQSRRHRGSRHREGGRRLSPDARRPGLRTHAAARPRRDYGLHLASQHQDRAARAARQRLADREISRPQPGRRNPPRLL